MRATTAAELQTWLDRQLELISLERAAEVSEASLLASNASPEFLQRNGLALLGLGVSSINVGLGGKTVIEFERPAAYHTDQRFPPHNLRNGDLVRVEAHTSGTGRGGGSKKDKAAVKEQSADAKMLEGVVFRNGETRVVVAVGKNESADEDIDLPERCRIIKLANDATFDRLEKTIKTLQDKLLSASDASVSHADPLTSVLLGLSTPTFNQAKGKETEWLDQNLNDSQKEAARFALFEAIEVALIHGPPGTGKTQTLCEVIRQLVQQGKRVLVCGASNLAVDNLVERLSLHQVPLTRLGHPARILENLHHVTLDSQIAHSSAGEVVSDIKKEMNDIVSELAKGKVRGKDRRAKWAEHKELRKELRKREGGVVSNVISQAKVVLATCHGAGGRQLQGITFDVAVIDEAAQALEVACWIPILKGKKLILAGDPLQLPPTVKSTETKLKTPSARDAPLRPASSLAVTLFERLLAAFGPSIKRMLAVQYRMHEKIMRFASDELYEGKLVAAESVKSRTLQDLVEEQDETLLEPIVFYDTAGADMFERSDSEGSLSADSKSNENEATLVLRHVKELESLGVDPATIAVISGYSAQVALLTSLIRPIYPSIQIGTVDGFQGREADVICLSLVRSNDSKEVGFLADNRRLNVAMTRPRRQLVVVGDSETVSAGTPYLKRWMSFLEENADVRMAGMLDL